MSVVKVEFQGDLAIITIDNPPVNALSQSVRSGIVTVMEEIDGNSEAKAAVLICAGRTFCAGADKEYLIGNIDEGYILSPGDVLRIYVFGENSYQTEVEIDLFGGTRIKSEEIRLYDFESENILLGKPKM